MSEEPRKSAPTWAYKGVEAKLFDHPDDVPKGWSDSPSKSDDPAPKRGPGRPKSDEAEN